MGIVLDDATILVVMTEKDGHNKIFGHVLFSRVEDANEAKAVAEKLGVYDNVFVTRWDVV